MPESACVKAENSLDSVCGAMPMPVLADLKAQPGAVRIGVQQVYAQSDLALGGEFDGVTDRIGQHLL